jgi:hypothetical protein
MFKLMLVFFAATLTTQVPLGKQGRQDSAVSAVVEKAIRDREPDWQLAKRQIVSSKQFGDVSNPDLAEDHVTLRWQQREHEVSVAVYKFKELEKARHLFSVGTITPVMRKGYKLTGEGEELKGLARCEGEFFNCVGFFTNRSINGRVESYDAVFMMGRVVVIVTGRKAELVQRFALHAARAIRAT